VVVAAAAAGSVTTLHAPKLPCVCCRAIEQYNLDRMDAEEDVDEEAAETEVNSNMLINLPQDQQNLITADFFRQAMLAAVAGNSGAGVGSVPRAAVVSEVSHRT